MKHFIHNKKNNNSFDIVHLSGPKSNYIITENDGTLFYTGKDTKNKYTLTEIEKIYWAKGTPLESTWIIEYAGFATTLNKLDIFNDGSCIAAYMLDKPIEMLSTNSLPNDAILSLELNGDSFADTTGKIVTSVNTVIDNNIKKTGTGSMRFSNDSSVTLPTSNDFVLGTDDFTIECDFNLSVNGFYGAIILEGRPTGTNGTYLTIGVGTTRKFGCSANNASIVTSNKVLNLNTWYHLVCQRKNGVFSLYIDGVFENSATPGVLNFTRNTFVLGRNAFAGIAGGSTPWTGNIDNFRIVKNSSLYTNVVTDLSGNYNGIPTNITYDTGKFGQAAVFNGTSKISAPQVGLNNIGKGSCTVTCWVKPSNLNGVQCFVYLGSFGSNQIHFGFSSGTLWGGTGNGTTWGTISSGSALTANVWTYVTMVVDRINGILKFYKNGIQVYSGAYTAMPTTTTSPLLLGTQDNSINYYNGSMDQVRIFNRALTQSEVTKLFNEK